MIAVKESSLGLARDVNLGALREPLADQPPCVNSDEASAIDADLTAVYRLHIRGLISDGAQRVAIGRITKRLSALVCCPS